MAQIDQFLEMIELRKIERAVLMADQPFQLFIGGQKTEGAVTSAAQLRQVLEEVTPPHLRPKLDQGGSFDFGYDSSQGAFNISADNIFGTLQVTITPTLAKQGSFSTAQPDPLVPPRPRVVETPVLPNSPVVATASPKMYCQHCSAPNEVGATFCSTCRQSLNVAIPTPQPAAINVTVTQQQNMGSGSNSNAGFWTAIIGLITVLLVPPFGCLTIPVLLFLTFFIFGVGIAFAPMVIALATSAIVWKVERIEQDKKKPIIAGIMILGIIMNGILLAAG